MYILREAWFMRESYGYSSIQFVQMLVQGLKELVMLGMKILSLLMHTLLHELEQFYQQLKLLMNSVD